MELARIKNILIPLAMVAVLAVSVFFGLNIKNFSTSQVAALSSNPIDSNTTSETPLPPQKLANPPEIIKAVYVTGYSAGSKKYLTYLSNLFNNTQINAVVVDIKGSDGRVSYPGRIKDIDVLIRFFHDQNIYVIGRIAVFEDPIFAKARPEFAIYNKTLTINKKQPVLWRDNNGLFWLDPASKDVWNYNISLAKNAFYHGFDEVNFDYIRFPSDGAVGNMGFPVWDRKKTKADVVKEFFQYLRANLLEEKISADLFGQTTTNKDDMGIGQLLENSFENFDYICPMVYPSHYVNGFMGFANPAEHPYEIINYSLFTALNREKAFSSALGLAKIRPWLQDFNMGANYTAEMVRQEIKATQNALGAEYNGFMLWNPSNIYTEGAIIK